MDKSDTSKTIIVDSLEQITVAAQIIIDCIGSRKIVLLLGDLGAGKTSLAQQMISILGYSGKVNSPTYSLINEYQIDNGIIYHMDLYRLKDLDEVLDIGIEDYLYSGNYCLIEWPELIIPLVEESNIAVIKISIITENTRKIEIVLPE